MEEIYVSFDASGHVEAAVTRYLDDGGGGQIEQPHEGMRLVDFDGDWNNVHFMRLADDGETLELDADYKDEVEAARAQAEEQRRAEAQAAALKQSQMATATSMYVSALALPRVQAVSVCMLYPDWDGGGVQYEAGDWVRYGGDLYRVEQVHTSQADWTPDAAPSLYTCIAMCPDGIRPWVVPTHAENAWDKGETCHYPDADGPVYRAKVNTAYDPDTVPDNWELVGGDA